MKKIKSETKILFDLVLGVLKSPFIFILALFGKRRFRDVFMPFKILFSSFFEPKFTVYLCFSLILVFFFSLFVSSNLLSYFLLYPEDIFSIRFFSLFTHGFLHANISHLFGNLVVIYVFGRIVESEFGFKKTALIYFFGLFFAGFFASLINLYQGISIGSLGASGAAMALVSSAVFFRPFYFSYVFLVPLPAFFIGWMFVYSDILGVLSFSDSGIGYFAHLGGFLASVLFLFYFNRKEFFKGFFVNLVFLTLFYFSFIYY
ncbi:MAG: rhomboid family intramembrane serine protease [Candidatus Woesearchaeota archaeon]